MSLPARDPSVTMAVLAMSGAKLLDAAREYFEMAHKAGIGGAVVWISDTDGRLVIFTRGEYREVLMRGIENIGPIRHFGCTPEET